VAGIVLGSTILFSPRSLTAQSCDRSCLQRALDTYVVALLQHDPSRARLAPSFRYTENALEVKAGEGIWKSVTKIGTVDRRYFDPVSGQAAFFGILEEGDGSGIATLRIRVVNQLVTEGELVIGRRANGIFNAEGLAASPPPAAPVADASRTPREALIAAASSYFDGLSSHKSEVVSAVPGCIRIENGVRMTGPSAGRNGGPPVDRGDCSNMTGMTQISGVSNRRFPVADEVAGVVVGMGVFNRPPGAARADGTLWPRNLLTEVFTVESGRISGIWAAMHYMTPDVPNAPGW
jgi:hypothetical protein